MRMNTFSMNPNTAPGTIALGYEAWINQPDRAASAELKLGDWWRMEQSYWRMAWIEETGELYAEELGPLDRFVLLKRLDRKEVLDLMRRWYDGDNLSAFLVRLNTARAVKTTV